MTDWHHPRPKPAIRKSAVNTLDWIARRMAVDTLLHDPELIPDDLEASLYAYRGLLDKAIPPNVMIVCHVPQHDNEE